MTLVLQDTLVLSPATAKELQQEIDDIKGATDCADVVGTYAELQAYDTSKLTDQAIIKVLQDSTHNDAQTYYRYDQADDSFTCIGELGPYYTKSEDDTLLAGKQDKPSSAVQNNIATFNNSKNTVDSGKSFTTSIAAESSAVDTKIPTEKAVRTELDTKQETLVSGTNIKTINGNNVLGSGDLELTQFLGFPSDWPTTSSTTTKAFCDVVAADADAIEGKMYLGEVRWSDLSTVGLVNAEVVVKVMKGNTANTKVIVLTMTSGNHAPYQWQYTYWNGGANTSGWIGFVPSTSSASKVYGTDAQGAQTTYNKDDFGKVDDIKINNTSIVNNKIANITIDNALNTSSTNAVQNGVVATAINNKSGVVFKTWSD